MRQARHHRALTLEERRRFACLCPDDSHLSNGARTWMAGTGPAMTVVGTATFLQHNKKTADD
jgi:hypothetical protein